MNFIIKTQVGQSAAQVLDGFDAELFLALKPPLIPLELNRFDGCEKGDKVHLVLGKNPISQEWHALISEHGEDETKFYFTDIGEKLPFPLKDWCHRHRIHKTPKGAIIEDNITYTSGWLLFDGIMFPLLYGMFFLRKRIYREYFKV